MSQNSTIKNYFGKLFYRRSPNDARADMVVDIVEAVEEGDGHKRIKRWLIPPSIKKRVVRG